MRTDQPAPPLLIDRLLVLAFGIYQALHVVVNGRYMFGEGLAAFPPPPGGWNQQTIEWARGMAICDWVVAVASVLFAIACWRRRRWSLRLGIVTTTAFVFTTGVFAIAVGATGAWSENPGFYTFIIVTSLPGLWLWGRLLRD